MQELQTVLIVILSIGFGILLILGIALVVMFINIMNNIRRVTQRLDDTSENMGEMAKYVGKKLAPAALSAMGTLLVRTAKSKIRKGKRNE